MNNVFLIRCRQILVLMAIFGFSSSVNAQTLDYKSYGYGINITDQKISYEEGNKIKQTKDGGFIIIGKKTESLSELSGAGGGGTGGGTGGGGDAGGGGTGGTGTGGGGGTNPFAYGNYIYVVRLDNTKTLIWDKKIWGVAPVGGIISGNGADIVEEYDSQGNLIGFVGTGTIRNFADANLDDDDDPTTDPTPPNYDIYIFRLDINGVLTWSNTYGTHLGDDEGTAIVRTANGFMILGNIRRGVSKICLIKIDNLYNTVAGWPKVYSPADNLGCGEEFGTTLAETFTSTGSSTGFVIGGTISAPCSSTPTNGNAFYVFKVNGNGTPQWGQHVDGPGNQLSRSIISTKEVNEPIVLLGESDSRPPTEHFPQGIRVLQSYPSTPRPFLLKFTANGNLTWIKGFDETYMTSASAGDIVEVSSKTSSNAGYIFTGGATVFESSSGTSPTYPFAVRVDPAGMWKWSRIYGRTSSQGNNQNRARGICNLRSGEAVAITGYTFNLPPEPNPYKNNDVLFLEVPVCEPIAPVCPAENFGLYPFTVTCGERDIHWPAPCTKSHNVVDHLPPFFITNKEIATDNPEHRTITGCARNLTCKDGYECDLCLVNKIRPNTGMDHSQAPSSVAYNIGGKDSYWTVTQDPTPGSTVPRKADVVARYTNAFIIPLGSTDWAPLPNPYTQWISYKSDGSTEGVPHPNGTYKFEKCFDICTETTAAITFDLFFAADDNCTVYIDGNNVGSAIGPKAPHVEHIITTLNLSSGKHCIEVEVNNTNSETIGLLLYGEIKTQNPSDPATIVDYKCSPSAKYSASLPRSGVSNTGEVEKKDLGLNSVPKVKVTPNPAQDYTTITYNVIENSNVQIEIYNSIGQLVKRIDQGRQKPGIYDFSLDSAIFSAGVYNIIILGGNHTFNATFTITR